MKSVILIRELAIASKNQAARFSFLSRRSSNNKTKKNLTIIIKEKNMKILFLEQKE